jgi:NADPH:quinone reductase-like Zn-dependent oxidoreductase
MKKKSLSMDALVINSYGDPNELKIQTVPKPTIDSPTSVIVKIHGAGINPVDYKIRKGYLTLLSKFKFPLILGIDYSGVIEQVGSDVVHVKVGDAVYGKFASPQQNGTYAQYAKLDTAVDAVILKPPSLPFEDAAGVGVVALTAYVGLIDHGKLAQGDNKRVLVIGASGGVGSWAVQIAKIHGANVTGICSTKNLDFVKSLGAAQVLDYTRGILHDELKKMEKFDIVIDAVGGDDYFRLIAPFINRNGVYSTAVGPEAYGGNSPVGISNVLNFASKLAFRTVFGSVSYKMVTGLPVAYLQTINDYIIQGLIKFIPVTTFPLQNGSEAHKLSETNHAVGKIILVPSVQ